MENLRYKLHRRLMHLDVALYIRLQDEGRLDRFFESFLVVPDPEAALSERFSTTRYDYIAEILEEDFLETYLAYSAAGILRYELINMTTACAEDFEYYRFPENTDDRMMRYAITGTIDEYLKGGSEDGI
ncbi:hypothetical protein J7E50_02715 [Pedobacter sp. ISL-68]|uniref:hypothetical protein n=1 Tax=unclassified Pedobacter TaxID=2628915 RepID=UPI001BE6D54B|nr:MULTISPECIES: hypothetical protein [unclassified Pedobacter]MBT2560132.1 hypothetical protein [Pedobacter sp. ISL-64]MBT2589111.1 hypothetical protein [Pedobacter sp. ISL-68]